MRPESTRCDALAAGTVAPRRAGKITATKSAGVAVYALPWRIIVQKTCGTRHTRVAMTRRRAGQIILRLRPQHGGAFTRWQLSGSLVTAISHRDLRQLMRKLSFWSGWPIELVLPAAAATAQWFEVWTHAIDHVPAAHLEVRFEVESPQPTARDG